MNHKNNGSGKEKEQKKVRVSKSDRPKISGKTNWAALLVEERKEGSKK